MQQPDPKKAVSVELSLITLLRARNAQLMPFLSIVLGILF